MNDALLTTKLRVLVRDRWAVEADEAAPFPAGATLRVGGTGWVLVGADGARRLGAALAWARQRHVNELHVLADGPDVAATLARRAEPFARPISVWRVDGRALHAATPAPAPTFAVPPEVTERFLPTLAAAGLDVVVEQGEVRGELRGLEVARVVVDPDDPAGRNDGLNDGARLDVGVGRFDREAFALMNADVPDDVALAKAIDVVARHRAAGAPRHPLNQFGRERWLRAALVSDPSSVGAATLTPIEPALPRANVKDPVPASAMGIDAEGQPVIVTCSAGVDLDLVPGAADDRRAHAPEARLVLALPALDVLPVTAALAAALRDPATIVTVPTPW